MNMKTRIGLAAVALAAMSALVLAQSDASKSYSEAMEKMMKDMHMQPSGDADKDFAMMMIPHHQGAIDMAKVELEHGKDPQLRKMAEGIIAAQEKEIAELKDWQATHQ